MARDDHAIIAGITLYPGLESLRGPGHDAEAFQAWVTDPRRGNVDPGNVHLKLTSQFHPPDPQTPEDAHPVEDELNQLFRPFVKKAGQKAGRRLYIFLAGHGFSDPNDMNSAALYAANAETMFAPHITATAYAEFFRRAAIFDEIVLIMDCCRVTSPLMTTRPPPLPVVSNPASAHKVRTFYAFGAAWGMISREKEIGGVPRGIFTVALLESLDLAPPDAQGRVTGQGVKNYLRNHFPTVAGDAQITEPEIRVDSDRDLVFFERAGPPVSGVALTLPAAAGGQTLEILDSAGRPVSQATVSSQPVHVQLTAGFYKARVDALHFSKLFEVVGDPVELNLG